jgi:hypothetical protein
MRTERERVGREARERLRWEQEQAEEQEQAQTQAGQKDD